MLLFYWFSWIIWIIITFFMKKGTERTYLAVWTLLLIMSSGIIVIIDGGRYFLSYLMLLFGLYYIRFIGQSFYLVFVSFTICLCYTSLLFWEQLTPVWMFMPRFVLIPAVLVILVMLLVKQFKQRLAAGLFGIMSGECFHGFTLAQYGVHVIVGGWDFFAVLTVFVMSFITFELIQKGNRSIHIFAQQHRKFHMRNHEQQFPAYHFNKKRKWR